MAAVDLEKLGFAKFTRSRLVTDAELVIVRATGVISFTPAIVDRYLRGTQWVNLYFREKDGTIAVVPANEKNGQFKLTAHGRRRSFSGAGFLVRYKLLGGKRPFKTVEVPVKLESGVLTFKFTQ